MTNIWGFLSQTIEVSFIALIILFLKDILKDKLPPRWQYTVWWVMAGAVFVPAGFDNRYVVRPVQLFLQAVKTLTERKLTSRFTDGEKVVFNSSIIPNITAPPQSITDCLFVIYVAGILLFVLRYIVTYFKLRKIMSKADKASDTLSAQVADVAQQYKLTACQAKTVDGIASAFVFGFIKPVLVLPKDSYTDDMVILHELLHLKHKDLCQKALWSILRILHWPNIFLQYVFNRISNDMESLCDQRVLELLQGEQRRDYGRILLSMTNEKYPSAFGTTSISNGGAFISERIKNIARFKKYPQGMGIVSVCILFMMAPLVVNGRQSPQQIKHINYAPSGSVVYQMQYEQYKMACCTTPAAAIDAFAKGLMFNTEEFLMAVKPDSVQPAEFTQPWYADINKFESGILYYVLGMVQQNEDIYTAQLMFKDYIRNSDTDYGTRFFIIPITCVKENGWKVYQSGDYEYYYLEGIIDSTFSPPATDDYKGGVQVQQVSGVGQFRLIANSISCNDTVDNNCFVHPHTEFSSQRVDVYGKLTVNEICRGFDNIAVVMASIPNLEATADTGEYWLTGNSALSEWSGGSNGPDGMSVCTNVPTDRLFGRYEGKIELSMLGTDENTEIPRYIQVDIFGGTELIKTLKIDLRAGEVYEY